MVDSKAGGVPVGGAQGTANAGASEFSGANFTYVKLDSGSDDWTALAGTDGGLAKLVEWASGKGTVVVCNGATAGLVYMIFEVLTRQDTNSLMKLVDIYSRAISSIPGKTL